MHRPQRILAATTLRLSPFSCNICKTSGGVPKAPPAWAAPLPSPPDPMMAWAGLASVYVTELGDCAHFSTDCDHLSNTYTLRKRICLQCGQDTRAGKALPKGLTEVWVTEFREIAHLSTTCGSLSNTFAIRSVSAPSAGRIPVLANECSASCGSKTRQCSETALSSVGRSVRLSVRELLLCVERRIFA